MKKKEERDGGEWLTGAYTQNIGMIPLNCNNTRQEKST